MPTITCGTSGRDYSTMQAAVNAIPSTPTGGYTVDCYADSEFTARVEIAGFTTSVANWIRLTAAAGQSFQDHANVRTNALYYDATKGVAIHANPGSAGNVIDVSVDHVTIDRIQAKRTVASYSNSVVALTVNNLSNVIFKDLILVKDFSANVAILNARNGKAINVLCINHGATVGEGITLYKQYGSVPRALNCVVVNTASSGGIGYGVGGGSDDDCDITNCASFGYAAATTAASTPTGNYNATNLASGMPGANSLFSRSAATEFESPSSAFDFRLKAGATMIGAGNTDATNAPNDISGIARGSGTAGDIGVWEAGGGGTPTISDAGDEVYYPAEIDMPITGTNFGASQGTGAVYLSPTNDVNDGARVAQTIKSWSDTAITFDVVRGALTLYTNLYLFVKNDGGASNASGYVVQLTSAPAVRAFHLLN